MPALVIAVVVLGLAALVLVRRRPRTPVRTMAEAVATQEALARASDAARYAGVESD
jgi:hypothetical protein